MAAHKPHINIVFIGHVDHGKSTTVGRLLYDSGTIDEQTIRKLKEKETNSKTRAAYLYKFDKHNYNKLKEKGFIFEL